MHQPTHQEPPAAVPRQPEPAPEPRKPVACWQGTCPECGMHICLCTCPTATPRTA